jgi:predicted ATPase/class 3 adenylate cyclase
MDSNISSGTYTFLFTDIEGSTKLVQKLGADYEKVLIDHHSILREVIKKFNGKEIDNAGDGFFIIFDKSRNAVEAVIEIQSRIAKHNWVGGEQVKVRMGIHTGEVIKNETGYVGIDVHRAARIGAAGHGGQVLISESTRALISKDLPEGISFKDLGEFNLKDLENPERIYQLVIPGLQSDFSPLKSSSTRKENLPRQITELIGREKEVGEVKDILMREGVRLVTLSGPGGTGKTSLAYTVAKSLVPEFYHGVYAVLLFSISDASLVATKISQSLGIVETGSKPVLESLKEFLHEKKILLFLDNYEQIVSSADILNDLLESCPCLKILVTSRILLHLKNEFEYFIPPLSLPESGVQETIETLSQYSAVKLFIERARSIKHDFKITNENAASIAEICIRLDGLPLAIELASARIKLFTPQMILSKLKNKIDILKSTSRSLPERHQTLRQAILWSYELLSDDEKKIFRWISVFVGGFTLEAIERIFSQMESLQMDILDGVEALLDKSLLRRTDTESESDEPRFFMLETIREFSGDMLPESEKKLIKDLHINYYLSLAEEAETHLTGSEQKLWLDKLQAEEDNFRSCFKWSQESGNILLGLKLCGVLWRFWVVRGNLIEGYSEMNKFLSIPESKNYLSEYAKVLNAAGTMLHEISNFHASLPLLEESLEIYKRLNDKNGIARVLNNISWVESRIGNLQKATLLCGEALRLNEEQGYKRGISVALNNIAWLNFFQGNFKESSANCKKNLILKQEIGDERGIAFALVNSAWALIMMNEFESAYKSLIFSMSILQNLGDRQLLAWANNIFGLLKYARGDYQASSEYITGSLKLMKEIGNEWGIAFVSCTLGHLKYVLGNNESARELVERSMILNAEIGSKWGLRFSYLYSGYISFDESKIDEALKAYSESLNISNELYDRHGIAVSFESITSVYLKQNKINEAGLLIGAAKKIRNEINSPMFAFEKKRTEKDIQYIIKISGENIINEGCNLNFEDALEIARR